MVTNTNNYMTIGDKFYVREGKWKCDKSPTSAHYWMENPAERGKFTCKHCKAHRTFPITFDVAFSERNGKNGKTNKASLKVKGGQPRPHRGKSNRRNQLGEDVLDNTSESLAELV